MITTAPIAEFEVTIPRTIATPNGRYHWAEKNRLVAALRTSVGLQAMSWRKGHKLPPADGKRRVELVLLRGKGQHYLDGDNAYGAVKPALDGLKDAGIIQDDDLRRLDVAVTQDRGATPALRISVWEA